MQKNLTLNNNFIFTLDRLKEGQLQVQRVNIPSINMGSVLMPSPMLAYPIPGEKLNYTELAIDFIVDENYTSYKEVVNWLLEIASYRKEHTQLSTLKEMFSDATLQVMSNNKNPIMTVDFVDCFPINVGDLSFDVVSGAETILCTMSMEFSYFTIK